MARAPADFNAAFPVCIVLAPNARVAAQQTATGSIVSRMYYTSNWKFGSNAITKRMPGGGHDRHRVRDLNVGVLLIGWIGDSILEVYNTSRKETMPQALPTLET